MSKVYATMTGFVGHGGQSVPLLEGQEFDAKDPLVVAHPEHFTAAAPGSAVVAEAKKRTAKSGG